MAIDHGESAPAAQGNTEAELRREFAAQRTARAQPLTPEYLQQRNREIATAFSVLTDYLATRDGRGAQEADTSSSEAEDDSSNDNDSMPGLDPVEPGDRVAAFLRDGRDPMENGSGQSRLSIQDALRLGARYSDEGMQLRGSSWYTFTNLHGETVTVENPIDTTGSRCTIHACRPPNDEQEQ